MIFSLLLPSCDWLVPLGFEAVICNSMSIPAQTADAPSSCSERHQSKSCVSFQGRCGSRVLIKVFSAAGTPSEVWIDRGAAALSAIRSAITCCSYSSPGLRSVARRGPEKHSEHARPIDRISFLDWCFSVTL